MALALLIVLASVPALASGREAPSHGPAERSGVKADRDGDGVFDDLERRMASLATDGRLPVIVTLTAPASKERVDQLKRQDGQFDVKRRFGLIDGFAATVTKGQVRSLARRPNVVAVEEDSTVRRFNNTAQESFGVTKAQQDAPSLDGDGDGNAAIYSKDDLVAAVIDTGIDPGHADLDGGKVIGWKDYVNGRAEAYDDEGHGTHVAATIAGAGDAREDRRYRGVAPGAALVGVKVLDRNGSGSMSDVAAGIEWVVNNRAALGIEAINLSLGTDGCSDGTDASSLAVNAAHDAGISVAVAAGNEGSGTCTIGSPAAAAKALTVGAMADHGQSGFYQAYFSSRGRTFDGRIKPDVSAPGVGIASAKAGTAADYQSMSGTSMAAPFVAGVALLMRDAASGLTSVQIKDRVMQTAVDWGRGGSNTTTGTTGVDIDYGAGRLDAYAALTAAGASLTAPPEMPTHVLRGGTLSATGGTTDFPLEVTDTKFPIAATMIMSNVTAGQTSDPNFDIELISPGGTILASSAYDTRQEELGHRPASTGTYTLRVRSVQGSGPFFVDISAGLAGGTAPVEEAAPSAIAEPSAPPADDPPPADEPASPTPDAAPAPAPAQAPAPAPAPAPAAPVAPAPPLAAPTRISISAPTRMKTATATRRGIRLRVRGCVAPCKIDSRAYIGRRTARSAGISQRVRFAKRYVRVGLGERRLRRSTSGRVIVRLSRQARKRLRRARSVTVMIRTTVRHADGTRKTVTRRIRVLRR